MSSDLPTPPWSTARATARRTPLHREAIVDAALAIVDTEGLEALSMRRLAAELGTGPASLYAHVSGKDELLQMLIDRVAGEVEVPEADAGRWQEQVKDFARQMRNVLLAHRDLAGASLANIPTGLNAVRATDGLLAIMVAGGLPPKAIAFAMDLLFQFITIDVYEGSLFAQRVERDPQYFERLRDYYQALPRERFPHFVGLLADVMDKGDDPDERFEFGLDLLVRGLAGYAPPPAS